MCIVLIGRWISFNLEPGTKDELSAANNRRVVPTAHIPMYCMFVFYIFITIFPFLCPVST